MNVVLECSERVAEKLSAEGAYIKWFRFIVRRQDAVPSCYRCLGFDNRIRECRVKTDICRRCSLNEFRVHLPIRCRNCEFKGLAAEHLILSAAGANVRH